MEVNMSDQEEDPKPETEEEGKPDTGPIKPPTKDDPPVGGGEG
jgi:hypothetical protein